MEVQLTFLHFVYFALIFEETKDKKKDKKTPIRHNLNLTEQNHNFCENKAVKNIHNLTKQNLNQIKFGKFCFICEYTLSQKSLFCYLFCAWNAEHAHACSKNVAPETADDKVGDHRSVRVIQLMSVQGLRIGK